MLGPFTFTFTLESEEFEKFEKVACLRICNRPWWTLELLTELIKKFMNTAMFQQAENVMILTNPNQLFNKALLSSLTSGHFIFKCVCLINTVYHHHPYSEKAFQVFIYHHRNFRKPSNFGLMWQVGRKAIFGEIWFSHKTFRKCPNTKHIFGTRFGNFWTKLPETLLWNKT